MMEEVDVPRFALTVYSLYIGATKHGFMTILMFIAIEAILMENLEYQNRLQERRDERRIDSRASFKISL